MSSTDLKFPKNERVWVSHYDKSHTLKYIITTKEKFRDYYYLYEVVNGEFKKVGRSRSPAELEAKIQC